MIEPLKDNVIIEPIDESVLPPSHIILPNRSRDDVRFGWVRFIGPDVQVLKPGNIVVLPTWNDDELEVDSKKYVVLAEKNISVRISE